MVWIIILVVVIVGIVNSKSETCSSGLTRCNGSCVDYSNDSSNCGSCGNICEPLSESCISGQCQFLS